MLASAARPPDAFVRFGGAGLVINEMSSTSHAGYAEAVGVAPAVPRRERRFMLVVKRVVISVQQPKQLPRLVFTLDFAECSFQAVA